jgi:hypothetical protein
VRIGSELESADDAGAIIKGTESDVAANANNPRCRSECGEEFLDKDMRKFDPIGSYGFRTDNCATQGGRLQREQNFGASILSSTASDFSKRGLTLSAEAKTEDKPRDCGRSMK